MSMRYVDGNALAGALSEIFRPETTSADAQCASCRRVSHLAEWHVFLEAPGAVARCPACGAVQLRVVQRESVTWLDLSGIRYLRFEAQAPR